jgi:hypothetical protein
MTKKELKKVLKGLNQLDLTLVEWIDCEGESFKEGGWKDISENLPNNTKRKVVAKTVGFFVGSNNDLYRTASNFDPTNNLIGGIDDIPLVMIKAIHLLKEVQIEPNTLSNSKIANPF